MSDINILIGVECFGHYESDKNSMDFSNCLYDGYLPYRTRTESYFAFFCYFRCYNLVVNRLYRVVPVDIENLV